MPREKEVDASVFLLRDKLSASLERNSYLEKENEQLKREVFHLKSQIILLQAQDSDKRSKLWKKVQCSVSSNTNSSQEKQRGEGLAANSSLHRPTQVPKPPPKPLICLTTKTCEEGARIFPPPPPPPPMQKKDGGSTNKVRRVPEVVELYRALTKCEVKPESRAGFSGIASAANTREMIGEIENKSAYLSAIKSDVETQGEFINCLTREVENAAYKEISDVEAFVKWLDEELSCLVDERAVLKHFPQWPEKKADAMREAACSHRDLKNLHAEVSSFQDDLLQSTPVALKQIQALQDKLERSVHNLQKVRESVCIRYKDFNIPWDWMLDSGIISQLKLGSIKLVKLHMNRVVGAVQSDGCSEDEDHLMLQSVRFAFRIHQFVGGFDEESRHAFQELRRLASRCNQ